MICAFYWERVESARNFANKLWNASRFMLMNLEGFDKTFVPEASDYTLADKWILSRYAKTAISITENLEKFELGEAGRSLYDFIWYMHKSAPSSLRNSWRSLGKNLITGMH